MRNKTDGMKQVGFRMLSAVHADYAALAESRGMDLSALLNWVLTECRPLVLLAQAKNNVGMMLAHAAGLTPHAACDLADFRDVLGKIRDLIDRLEAVETELSPILEG